MQRTAQDLKDKVATFYMVQLIVRTGKDTSPLSLTKTELFFDAFYVNDEVDLVDMLPDLRNGLGIESLTQSR